MSENYPPGGSPPPPPPPYGGSPPPYGSPPPPGGQIPNYLVQSILATIFCCVPAGIVAIVFAAQVNGKQQSGDIEGAMRASKNAKTWSIVAAAAGLVVALGYLAIFVLAASTGNTNGDF